MSIRSLRLKAAGTAPLAHEIVELYRLCYAAPPWSETPEQLDAYRDRLAHALTRPGFVAHLARETGGRLVGVCYGWPTPAALPDTPLYRMLRQALGATAAGLLTPGSFELVELFVHPDTRGHGLGRALITDAITDRHTAWLITSPQAPAARLYQHLGWRRVADLPSTSPSQLPLTVFHTPPPAHKPPDNEAEDKARPDRSV
jgi:GNAT superfamily N-acetyltransferase